MGSVGFEHDHPTQLPLQGRQVLQSLSHPFYLHKLETYNYELN